ncbi:MAG: YlbL family protein [Gaiellaceae bacterium]
METFPDDPQARRMRKRRVLRRMPGDAASKPAAPGRSRRTALGALAVILAAAAILGGGFFLASPSNTYILAPDRAHPLASVVTVKGAHADSRGGIYFVDVLERRLTWAERLFPPLRGEGTLLPKSAVVPANLSDSQAAELSLQEMRRSQQVASAVALKALGYPVHLRPLGVRVLQLVAATPAARALQAGDVILAVDGRRVPTPLALKSALRRVRPGSTISLRIERSGTRRTLRLKTIANPEKPSQALIGIVPGAAVGIPRLPVKVKIDAEGVGGPSAGLAFALEIVEKLGRDIDRGQKIAATGELAPDGSVLPIGGAKEKAIGASQSGIQIFLVPAGENAQEARPYAGTMKIVPVSSFQQALRALATITLKQQD